MLCSHFVYCPAPRRRVRIRALIGKAHLSVRGWREVSSDGLLVWWDASSWGDPAPSAGRENSRSVSIHGLLIINGVIILDFDEHVVLAIFVDAFLVTHAYHLRERERTEGMGRSS